MITEETAIEMSVPVEVVRVTKVREELTLPVLREGSLYVFENAIYEVRCMAGSKGIHRVLRCLKVRDL
jgi:hypothetical protein